MNSTTTRNVETNERENEKAEKYFIMTMEKSTQDREKEQKITAKWHVTNIFLHKNSSPEKSLR